ncbi:MAG: efflux RND transporter permease subunit [Gammaproteobacteria bacterium]|nr:efflux RND transporter permease subunit [Gammaproteobacteria bacterium]
MKHKNDLLGIFVNHKVAPNLLMVIMILAGLVALKKLNVQFFPNFELEAISISTVWSGASAEDIERAITIPQEQRLRNVDGLDEMSSSSAPGVSGITLNFEEGMDMILALDQVKKQIDDFTSLPQDAEQSRVSQSMRYESVARLLISGPDNLDDLRKLARKFEQQLLERGIDKVDLEGLPKESILISVPSEQMYNLGLSLSQIGDKIDRVSQDLPAGLAGENDGTRELRSLNQRRTPKSFEDLPVLGSEGNRINLGDIAHIERRIKSGSETISLGDKKSAVLVLRRSEHGDSLKSAEILQQWLDEVTPILPPNVTVTLFSERWQLIKQRIMLLLKNGAGGLILVLFILYAFLSTRVAFWVAVGIPVSFMATLAVIYLAGGSINMISLFGLIMALGIIVDDAIVVGEDAQAHFDMGEDSLKASEGGARRMLSPVMASSLTTIAAFLPLMLIGGRMGNIMQAIPMVIISVIIASLIESFLILPGHLRHAFVDSHRDTRSALRVKLDNAFEFFRDRLFRPFITLAIEFRWSTIAMGIGVFILTIGLILGSRVGWRFFPSPESTTVYGNVRFVAGSGQESVDKFLTHMEDTLQQTIEALDEKVVDTYYVRHASSTGQGRAIKGERNGSIYVELTAPDSRKTNNNKFIKAWNKRVKIPAGVESFKISSRKMGPSRRDLSVRLTGDDPLQMKLAALELSEALKGISGVTAVDDDLPYGFEQLIYSLTPAGEALGLSIVDLGRQLRAAYDGILLQRFQDGADEVDVRIQLPDSEKRYLTSLDELPVQLADGRFVPLNSVASWESRQGFETLRHSDGLLAVSVTADVNEEINNTEEITADLRDLTLPELTSRYGIGYSLEGRAASQRETLTDMRIGVGIAFAMIYLVLAWVFSSYGWPLLVMLTIPLGLTGAVLGHWVMGMDMTMLSLFGFFGLSGIVVNDSIILVTFYKHIRAKGLGIHEALVEAACQRLRAVLLTSLTTIAGLTPLLFETSRQAQFLIPMAVSIAFGLAYATLLILMVIPAMLSVYEDVAEWFRQESYQAEPEVSD